MLVPDTNYISEYSPWGWTIGIVAADRVIVTIVSNNTILWVVFIVLALYILFNLCYVERLMDINVNINSNNQMSIDGFKIISADFFTTIDRVN